MIRQQVGDILEIHFEGKWFYLVVLSKVVMLGGTIVFAFHNDGARLHVDTLLAMKDGFNICTDLLLPKKVGTVTRIAKVADTAPFFRTRYSKGTNNVDPSGKADRWYIYRLDDLRQHIAVVRRLSREHRGAMDHCTYSFDLACEKILSRYLPEQDPRISSSADRLRARFRCRTTR